MSVSIVDLQARPINHASVCHKVDDPLRALYNYKVTDLVPEFLNFIFPVLDSALQSSLGSMVLVL